MTTWVWQDLTPQTAPDLPTLRTVLNQRLKRLEQALAPVLDQQDLDWATARWDDGTWPVGPVVQSLQATVQDHENRLDAGGL